MRAALRAMLLAAAIAAPGVAFAAADAPLTVVMAVPPPVAIHPIAEAEPAAAQEIWRRTFGGDLPADIVAFALPDIRAQFNPNRTATGGGPPKIEVTYAIVGFTPVLVHGRYDACHEARLVEELALARRHAEILNGKAMMEVKQDAERRLKAAGAHLGTAFQAQVSEALRAAFLKERAATLGSFRTRTTIDAGMLRAVRCGAPIRARDDIPAQSPPPDAPAAPPNPPDPSATNDAASADPAPRYTSDDEMQQILQRMQQTKRSR